MTTVLPACETGAAGGKQGKGYCGYKWEKSKHMSLLAVCQGPCVDCVLNANHSSKQSCAVPVCTAPADTLGSWADGKSLWRLQDSQSQRRSKSRHSWPCSAFQLMGGAEPPKAAGDIAVVHLESSQRCPKQGWVNAALKVKPFWEPNPAMPAQNCCKRGTFPLSGTLITMEITDVHPWKSTNSVYFTPHKGLRGEWINKMCQL